MSSHHTRASLTALKVGDLRELCTAAGLLTTGVKAELIARLLDRQLNAQGAPAASNHLGVVPDEVNQPASTLKSPTTATTTQPTPTPTRIAEIRPQNGASLPSATEKNDADGGAQNVDVEAELAKRKARGERFGLVVSAGEGDEEARKRSERSARFGTTGNTTAGISALDVALDDLKSKRARGGKQRVKAPQGKPPQGEPAQARSDWEDKKRRRAERFGVHAEDASVKRPKV